MQEELDIDFRMRENLVGSGDYNLCRVEKRLFKGKVNATQ